MATFSRAHVTRAYALAYFFHPDRTAALQITARAMAKVGLAERAQARRIHYKPKGRRLRPGAVLAPMRTKVSVDRAQLLQRLVLLECDLLDRRDEETDVGAMTEEQFVLRFIRQLVWSSSRRNSLYVATALGRILHSYTTAEVQELFSVVVQEPERTPDDSYVRSLKQSLFAELKRRFGGLVRTRTGPRGEEAFETDEPSTRWRRLVDACLEELTPWDTPCPVPRGFDAFGQTLKSLRSIGSDPEAEHPIEVRRMHTLIHPDCFARLTKGLGLQSPAELLSVPKLFSPRGPSEGNEGNPGRSQPPPLEDSDLDRLHDGGGGEHEVGNATSHVSFRVDGPERASLSLDAGASCRFDVHEADAVLEIVALAGEKEVPLALHLLGSEPLAGDPPDEELVVAIGRRWKLEVTLRRLHPWTAAASASHVEATCLRMGLLDRARKPARRWDRWGAPPVRWVVAVPALALVLMAGWFAAGRLHSPAPQPGRGRAVPVRPAEPTRELTRGATSGGESITLESARSIYVHTLRGPEADRVSELLTRALAQSGRFTVVDSPDAAEIALKGTLEAPATPSPSRPNAVRLDLQLVDERGRELWTATADGRDWESVVQRVIADLLDDAS